MATKKKVLMASDATLRDYFAAHAISNPISSKTYKLKETIRAFFIGEYNGSTVVTSKNVEEAYRVADEMIKQRLLK